MNTNITIDPNFKAPSEQQVAITLWGVSLSPYVRKVQIALAEKNLTYTHHQVMPTVLASARGQKNPDAFAQVSPLGKIPAIQIANYHLADSAVICAYLDKKFPEGTQLYPICPEAYAKVRWFENYADTIFTEVAYKKIFLEAIVKPAVFGTTPAQATIEHAITKELPPYLNYLEQTLSDTSWIAGEQFSVADVALITHFISLQQADYQVDSGTYPKLYHYIQRVIARPAIKTLLSETASS